PSPPFLFYILILLAPRSTLFPYTTLFRSERSAESVPWSMPDTLPFPDAACDRESRLLGENAPRIPPRPVRATGSRPWSRCTTALGSLPPERQTPARVPRNRSPTSNSTSACTESG